MERISIFNYEAFYLDFLEGNLNEEETTLFLNFMQEHPELRLEDASLVAIENDCLALDQSFKENLKHLNLNETVISVNNVEQFLIAQIEGLLSSTKNAELNNFITKDTALLRAQRQYEFTKMHVDLSIVYTDKSSLKQARRVALWPLLSLAAAASVAVFFFVGNPSMKFGQSAGTSAKIHLKDVKKPTSTSEKPTSTIAAPVIESPSVFVESSSKENQTLASTTQVDKLTVMIHLKVKKLKGIPVRENENELEEQTFPSVDYSINTEIVASNYGFQDMKNPIKPITNRLSDVVKQEVDFRTAKATEKTPGGFYLKIGKLEISHKTN
jgi:hypothetical protein